MQKLLSIFLVAIAVAGCGGNTNRPAPGTDVVKTYPPHDRPIPVVRGDLPPGTKYEVLALVKSSRSGYGSDVDVERQIAANGRALGADVIIKVNVWRQPNGMVWAAPHADWLAGELLQPETVQLHQTPGA